LAKQFLIHNKDYAGDKIQGQRIAQEDDFGFDNSRTSDFLMILADGMGGHQGGDYASRYAIKTFMEHYESTSGEVNKRLWRALHETNTQLGLEAKTQSKLKGMGCTLVGAVFNGKQLEWISVGDSPLWLYRAERLYRLNADHSMKPILQEMVQDGELTPTDEIGGTEAPCVTSAHNKDIEDR
jgi:serine/threonine protein phosphatase PrpC